MEGVYLEWQIRHNIVRPIVAFRTYISRDMLPQFNNLDQRAQQVANEYYEHATYQYSPENFDGDLSGFTEDANDEGIAWYQMMRSLQQTMMNLLVTGLYHLAEQQLAMLCRDGGFLIDPPKDTKLEIVSKWYRKNLRLDLDKLSTYQMLQELGLVANTVKHGEGRSCDKLKKIRPDLFTDPFFAKFLEGMGSDPEQHLQYKVIAAPLAGEDLFVTEEQIIKYGEWVEKFFLEIADHFAVHANDFY